MSAAALVRDRAKRRTDIDESTQEEIVPSERLRQVLCQASASLGALLDKIDAAWLKPMLARPSLPGITRTTPVPPSIDSASMINNVVGLAKSARGLWRADAADHGYREAERLYHQGASSGLVKHVKHGQRILEKGRISLHALIDGQEAVPERQVAGAQVSVI